MDATAKLIAEVGTAKITHRLVAERAGVSLGSTTRYFSSLDELITSALEKLAAEIDADLESIRRTIETDGCLPEVIAQFVYEFLTDKDSVRVNIEMINAAISDPSLRSLAMRWGEGLRGILAAHVGREAAQGVVALVDGASAQAALSGEPIDFAVLQRIFGAVLQVQSD